MRAGARCGVEQFRCVLLSLTFMQRATAPRCMKVRKNECPLTFPQPVWPVGIAAVGSSLPPNFGERMADLCCAAKLDMSSHLRADEECAHA